METRTTTRTREMTAVLICPDRHIADEFSRGQAENRSFQVLSDLSSYPAQQVLDIRLRQLKPELVLIDVATDLEAALELIRFTAAIRPSVHVIGLHRSNHSDAIIRALRAGATEFLYPPFDPAVQKEALARLCKLLQPDPAPAQGTGKVVIFSSVKPGSGASTLATQTAFAVRRVSNKRVLLADFDLTGGAIGFYLKLHNSYSLLDALVHSDRMDSGLWSSLTVHCGGIDILPAPEMPYASPVEQMRFHDVLEYARMMYDWVILDVPAIFHRISLLALSESDLAYLVSTSELASLHMARKAVHMLAQLGIEKSRYQVVVNRVDRRDGINGSDLEKLFNCPVDASFPNDYFSLHRVVTLGQPLGMDCDLGKAIDSLAGKLAGSPANEKRRVGSLAEAKPVYSQT